MRRFSILSLMGLILAVAVGFAALRGANGWWAGGFVLATLGLLGYSILASWHNQGQARAAWLGFLVLGGGYFLAVRTLPVPESRALPTSQLLAYVDEQVVGARTYSITLMAPSTPGAPMPALPTPPGLPGTVATVNVSGAPGQTITTSNFVLASAPGPTFTTWGRLLPGAADTVSFNTIGHCLFGLLFGWIGMVISRRMWSKRHPDQAITSVDPAQSPFGS